MKKLSFVIIALFASFGLYAETQKYSVNLEESYLKWEASRVGGAHDGKVKIKSGHLEMRGSDLIGGEFIIDMTSISVDDIKDESRNARLRNHLLSDDFFSVEKYETAKIEIKDAQFGKGGVYNVVGELTIKDKAHPIMFDANIDHNDTKVDAKAEIEIDRTKWGVRYRSGSFFESLGDRLIHDEVKIAVHLKAAQKN